MRKRYTVEVTKLVEDANYILKQPNISKAERAGICYFLEKQLMEVDHYKGFIYLPIEVLPEGVEPGIAWDSNGNSYYPDEYRRAYYL